MFQSRFRLNSLTVTGAGQEGHVVTSVPTIDKISRVISAARRHMWHIIACCLVCLAAGSLYVVRATPLYTASAQIIMDYRQARVVHDVSTLTDESAQTLTDVIESQVEVLRGESVGLAVVKDLNLSEDPAFVAPPKSWIGGIWAAADPAPPVNDADPGLKRQLTALKTLNKNLRISRIGLTSVVEVAYTSPNPVRAAEIANAYTNAYMLGQLSLGIEATRRAGSWLQQRTEELRQKSVDADLTVQKFRADNNLLGTAKEGLIAEQQLNEMTTELVKARAATAEARARYERLKYIIDTHQTDAAVAESLGNQVINGLRSKYLDAVSRLAELRTRKLAPDNLVVVHLESAIDELSALLFQELGRVAQSYRNDYEVASAREKAVAENLAQQQKIAVVDNDAQAQLRQLEQRAESYKSLYQSYMQRTEEASQLDSFPMTEGHVVNMASPPLAPSSPRIPLVLAISLALGAVAGVGAAALRELMDDVIRTAEQVHDELGVELLGMLPIIPEPQRVQGTVAPIYRYTIDHPFSEFAEALRSAKAAADRALLDRSPKVVGLVSFLPNEGKSTVAKNFASLLALQGAKTLLIDADTRKAGLTRALGYKRRQRSRSEVSMPPLIKLLEDEPDSGLKILPCIFATDDRRSADGLSPAMLESVGLSFEYIVIDLPPIGPTVNARAMESKIDAFIFVIEWGKTNRGAVSAALAREHSIREKLIGVILNKVEREKLKNYEHFRSDGYYRERYDSYYKTAD
jgi:polysaccharide biosynthesis transport protein